MLKEFLSSKTFSTSLNTECPQPQGFFLLSNPSLAFKIKTICSDIELFASDKTICFKTTKRLEISKIIESMKNQSYFDYRRLS